MCRDRTPDDNCQTNSTDARILTDLENNKSAPVSLNNFIEISF